MRSVSWLRFAGEGRDYRLRLLSRQGLFETGVGAGVFPVGEGSCFAVTHGNEGGRGAAFVGFVGVGSRGYWTVVCFAQYWSKAAVSSAAICSGVRPSMFQRSSIFTTSPSRMRAIDGDDGR